MSKDQDFGLQSCGRTRTRSAACPSRDPSICNLTLPPIGPTRQVRVSSKLDQPCGPADAPVGRRYRGIVMPCTLLHSPQYPAHRHHRPIHPHGNIRRTSIRFRDVHVKYFTQLMAEWELQLKVPSQKWQAKGGVHCKPMRLRCFSLAAELVRSKSARPYFSVKCDDR